jgi:hypothetical protein
VRSLVEAGADRNLKSKVSVFDVLCCTDDVYKLVLELYICVGDMGVYLASVEEQEKDISKKIFFQKNSRKLLLA